MSNKIFALKKRPALLNSATVLKIQKYSVIQGVANASRPGSSLARSSQLLRENTLADFTGAAFDFVFLHKPFVLCASAESFWLHSPVSPSNISPSCNPREQSWPSSFFLLMIICVTGMKVRRRAAAHPRIKDSMKAEQTMQSLQEMMSN